jgi:chemotaxis protein methyltransferase CheR
MDDKACIDFLQHYLPKCGYRWKGFRKVRNQVCKRINKRIRELDLADIEAYGEYLQIHGEEMKVLDAIFNITISRFYRDRGVFDSIANDIFPALAEKARQNQKEQIRCWSAGSASGEEPYTLSIIWKMAVLPKAGRDLTLRIIATDRNAHLIERAEKGIYPGGALKELPREWKKQAFEKREDEYQIKNEFRQDVQFLEQDIRLEQPEGAFDLIICRNLVFTYFVEDLQRDVFKRIMTKLNPGGYLCIGNHESLPESQEDLVRLEKCVYWKRGKDDM